jgi:hypothetical protein
MATPYKWTIMFLVNAENNLFNESIKAIEEIYAAATSSDIKFLIIFDGFKGNKFSKPFGLPSIYEANKENGFFIDHPVINTKDDNLTNKAVLKRLLKFIKEKYPADNYGFFYKGHGGAAEGDIGSGRFFEKLFKIEPNWSDEKVDEVLAKKIPGWAYEGNYRGFARTSANQSLAMAIYSRKNGTSLSYAKLADCLCEVFGEKGLSFVCLDCCWGQQIENAVAFSAAAHNFIASADETPALGVGYLELCSKIITRPQISPEEIANLIIAIFYFKNYADYDSPVPEFRQMGVSFTNVKTSAIFDNKTAGKFITTFKKLCTLLEKNIQTYAPCIMAARKLCTDYTYAKTETMKARDIIYPVFNIDLPWFLENLRYFLPEKETVPKQLISELLFEIQKNIIAGYLGNNYKETIPGTEAALGGNGITITFPIVQEHADISILKNKENKFYKATGWASLLQKYYETTDKLRQAKSTPLNKRLTIEKPTFEAMLEENTTIELPEPPNKARWNKIYKTKFQIAGS